MKRTEQQIPDQWHFLSETRTADRRVMFAEVRKQAERFGFTVEVVKELSNGQEIHFRLRTARKLTAMLDFSRRSIQPNIFVVSWYFDFPSSEEGQSISREKLSPAFWADLNKIHFHKATVVAGGFVDLITKLETCYAAIADGRAFQQ